MKNGLKSILLAPDGDPNAGAGGGAPAASSEDLKQAIEKARLEERKKLNDQLTRVTQELEALKTQFTSLQAEKAKVDDALSAAQTAMDALKAGTKSDGGVDVEKAIQTAVNAALAKQGPTLQAEIAKLREELDTERQLRTKAELDQVRARMIEEAGGAAALIPELVSGNNQEELAASIARSKQILERSLASVGSSGGSSTATGAGKSGLPSVPLGKTASAGSGSAAAGTTQPLIPGGRMSLKDYATKREQLKAEALARATGG